MDYFVKVPQEIFFEAERKDHQENRSPVDAVQPQPKEAIRLFRCADRRSTNQSAGEEQGKKTMLVDASLSIPE
jgi:hypothetical protein